MGSAVMLVVMVTTLLAHDNFKLFLCDRFKTRHS